MRTSEGRALREHWEGGPLTYLGLMVSGFPNMFVVTGPEQPGREDADDRRPSNSMSTGSPMRSIISASISSIASSPRRRPRSTGCITSTPSPSDLERSTRSPIPGTWAPTSRANRRCSCPMSAASTATRSTAMPCAANGVRRVYAVAPRSRHGLGVLRPSPHRRRTAPQAETGRATGEDHPERRHTLRRLAQPIEATARRAGHDPVAARNQRCGDDALLGSASDVRGVRSQGARADLAPDRHGQRRRARETTPSAGSRRFEPHWPGFLELCTDA